MPEREKAEKRAVYTLQEREYLKKLVLKHKETVENKRTDAPTLVEKNKAWKEIEIEFNVTANHKRTCKQLKKLWNNLKTERKKQLALLKVESEESMDITPTRSSDKELTPSLPEEVTPSGCLSLPEEGMPSRSNLSEEVAPSRCSILLEEVMLSGCSNLPLEVTLFDCSNLPEEVKPSRSNLPKEMMPSLLNSPEEVTPSRLDSPDEITPRSNLPKEMMPSLLNSPEEVTPSRLDSPDEITPSRSTRPEEVTASRSNLPEQVMPPSSTVYFNPKAKVRIQREGVERVKRVKEQIENDKEIHSLIVEELKYKIEISKMTLKGKEEEMKRASQVHNEEMAFRKRKWELELKILEKKFYKEYN